VRITLWIACGVLASGALAACQASTPSNPGQVGASAHDSHRISVITEPYNSSVTFPEEPKITTSASASQLTDLLAKLNCATKTRPESGQVSDGQFLVAYCTLQDGSVIRVATTPINSIRDEDAALLTPRNVVVVGDLWNASCDCPPADLAPLGGTSFP